MSVVRAFLYVVSASKSADEVSCRVPWRVDDREVFFGPCKKRLREKEFRKWLGDGEVDHEGGNAGHQGKDKSETKHGLKKRVVTCCAWTLRTGPRGVNVRLRERGWTTPGQP